LNRHLNKKKMSLIQHSCLNQSDLEQITELLKLTRSNTYFKKISFCSSRDITDSKFNTKM